ncbi:MAG: HAD-IC family P-type ATPase, partial [Oscillospiraceae bacterium]|nr:HAD-IC family P-type ATPase [Oscillospiraceae bacterium]
MNKRKHRQNRLTKTVTQIIFENTCTLFNLVNIILLVALLLVGSYKNILFMGVITLNTLIGIVQEIRAKISVDKLSILAANKVTVIKNGSQIPTDIYDIEVGDTVLLRSGDQIPVDCEVVGEDCSLTVDESLITGESDVILKKCGEALKSGSFVVSGREEAVVTARAEDSFAQKLEFGAKYIKKVNSEIEQTQKRIIKINSLLLIPIGLLLFFNAINYDFSGFFSNVTQSPVTQTCAALIGMIPEGLMLLTSTVLSVSVIRLSRSKVLVSELFCIESLARVDTLCLDKTGTLTTGNMAVAELIDFDKSESDNPDEQSPFLQALGAIAQHSTDENATITAIKKYTKENNITCTVAVKNFIPFSSQEKCSGVELQNGKMLMLGNPPAALQTEKTEALIKEKARQGLRVLAVFD